MLLDEFKKLSHRPKILVLGDLMLDRYTSGLTNRISQEAPVLVLKTAQQEDKLGGAASVAHMLAALDAEIVCMGVRGNDAAGDCLIDLLRTAGIRESYVLAESDRPTTLKQRFVGRSGSGLPSQVLRVDTEVTKAINTVTQSHFLMALTHIIPNVDAVIISDYDKGVCTEALLAACIQQCNEHSVPVLVDPGRNRPVSIYRGATLIKPNRVETQLAVSQSIVTTSDAMSAGRQLCQDNNIASAVITLDSDGMCYVNQAGESEFVPAMSRAVFDITGAGDMVISMLGLCLASRLSPSAAIQLANVAAGMEVDRAGVAVLCREEIEQELGQLVGSANRKQVSARQAARLAEEYRRRGHRVVFTNGCFDLLHVGHVSYLEEASRQGDVLIVGVNSDASVRRLKGSSRPVICEVDRSAMLSALACVDHVVVFDDDTPCQLLHDIQPDILVKGGTYRREEVVGYEIVEAYGGEIRLMNVVEGVSTTRIIGSLAKNTQLKKAG
ncbi:MAG: D-glycero-beta-D-manno-heptose 1-phosphate adenylyltransferase [Planctomycetales bacterium]|nr:D-glycero-beta-D-manno-heptose 1-phosphate adenylyltransferase [Planctomycetales bacterium]